MCGPALLPIAMIAGSVLAAGASIYSADKSASSQKKAMQQSEQQAETQAANDKAANERLINSANQKKADYSGMVSSNLQAASGGIGSTMLTGSAGAQPNSSMLGRTTLLGQ